MATGGTAVLTAAAAGLAAGVVIGLALRTGWGKRKSKLLTEDADDDFQSLFYPIKTLEDGRGVPETRTLDPEMVAQLSVVHNDYRFLPKDFYMRAVENMVITCVDVIVQRKSDKRILLFYRRDPPAKGIWWWPGGRMFRGETFADAATRKVRDETDGRYSAKPRGVVHCWNTFFPDSAWDAGRETSKRGTQTVNIVVACECDEAPVAAGGDGLGGAVKAWAVEAQRWVTIDEAIAANCYDKYVHNNVTRALDLGLLER